MPAIDPRKLKPSDLVRLLNSTPLGAVLDERRLHRHRMKAGYRIGDGRQLDLLRYAAWLVDERHGPKPVMAAGLGPSTIRPDDAANSAANGAAIRGVTASWNVCRRCLDDALERDPVRWEDQLSTFVVYWKHNMVLCTKLPSFPSNHVPEGCPYFALHAAADEEWNRQEEERMGMALGPLLGAGSPDPQQQTPPLTPSLP